MVNHEMGNAGVGGWVTSSVASGRGDGMMIVTIGRCPYAQPPSQPGATRSREQRRYS